MVFGYDEAAVKKAQARARVRNRVVLGAVVAALAAALVGGFVTQRTYTSVSGLQGVADGLTAGTPVRVTFADVEIHKGSAVDPRTWRAALLDVHAEVTSPPVSVDAARVEIDVANLFAASRGASRDLGDVSVDGLRVAVGAQPAAGSWEASEDGVVWYVDLLEVADAEVAVAADGVRPAFDATGIAGTLKELQYTTGDRTLSGNGSLKADRAQVGAIELGSPNLDKVVARDGIIGFEGRAVLMGAELPVRGQFAGVGRKVEATGVVDVEELPLETFMRAATGEAGPLRALVSGRMGIVAGGKRDPGVRDVNIEGTFADGRIVLGDPVKNRALSKLVPTSRLADNGDVTVGNLRGKVISGSSGVEIKQLTAEGPPQTRLRGQVAPDLMLIVRSIDKHEVYVSPGKGAVITRDDTGAYQVRRGTSEELILPVSDKSEE